MPRSRSPASRLRHAPAAGGPGWHADAQSPAVSALRAVEQALRQGRVERAWIDLDNAALSLARQGGLDGDHPALGRAASAVERARDLLGRAQASQAMAVISGALMTLLG